MYPSLVEIHSVTSEIRRRKKEIKNKKTTTVKYNPFGIALWHRDAMHADIIAQHLLGWTTVAEKHTRCQLISNSQLQLAKNVATWSM